MTVYESCRASASVASRAWYFVISIVRDPHDGTFSAVNLGSLITMWALTNGFQSEVATRQVDWSFLVGYAAAMVLASGAPLADRVLSLLGSRTNGPPVIPPTLPTGGKP